METLQSAILIGNYLAEHALVAFEFMGADPAHETAKDVLRWIRRTESHEFSIRDAHQALRGKYSKVNDIEAATELLVDHFYIRHFLSEDNHRTGRKRSKRFCVNPNLHPQNPQKTQKTQKTQNFIQPPKNVSSEGFEHVFR